MEAWFVSKGRSLKLKSPLEIHNEMFERYRKDVELVGSMTSDEVYKIAPEITPIRKHKRKDKDTRTRPDKLPSKSP